MCITNFIIKNKLRVTIPESPTFMLKFESNAAECHCTRFEDQASVCTGFSYTNANGTEEGKQLQICLHLLSLTDLLLLKGKLGILTQSLIHQETKSLCVYRTGSIQLQIYTGLIDACRQILSQEGVLGFYRGLTPSLIQIAPQMGLQFGFYSLFTGLWNRAKGVWFDSAPG